MKNRKKEDGRPKGTLKKYPFEQTKLGFMLKYEVPVVFNLIMKSTPRGPFAEPSISMIERICSASPDPSLKKSKFFRYMDEYYNRGLYCLRPKIITSERRAYYDSIRKRKLEKYIRKNRKRISSIQNRSE